MFQAMQLVTVSGERYVNEQKNNINTIIVRPIDFVGVKFLCLPNALSQDLRNVGYKPQNYCFCQGNSC
jgi:hypothetical protein